MQSLQLRSWFARVTAWIGLILEVIAFANQAFMHQLSEKSDRNLQYVGGVLFLVSLIGWLEESSKGLKKLDDLSQRFKELDIAARYGANAASIAQLLSLENRDAFPHCLAGGKTLEELFFETYATQARDFHRIAGGEYREVNLTEASIINNFLANLVKQLPNGSVWMGLSRLQDTLAWSKGTAEPSFLRFQNALEQRTNKRELSVLRVLCCGEESRYDSISREALRQTANGLKVRVCVKSPMPNDITLIWIPKGRARWKADFSAPATSIQRTGAFELVCGISFNIRGDREVFKMDMIVPKGNEILGMAELFEKTWLQARTVSADHENGMPASTPAPPPQFGPSRIESGG